MSPGHRRALGLASRVSRLAECVCGQRTRANMAQMTGVMLNRRLRQLLSAFALLNIAEWGMVTAVAIHLYRVSGVLAVSLVGFRLVPAAMASVAVAPLVRRWRGSNLLSLVTTTRCALIALVAVALAASQPIFVALLLIALDAAVSAAYRPTQSSLIPLLADTPKEVSEAAAGVSMVKTLGQGLGAFLGGILSEILLPGTIVAGAAALMGLAALTTLRLAPTTRPAADVARPSLRESLVQTRAVLRDRLVAPIIYLSGLRCLVRGLWTALVVPVALHLLELGPSGVGILTGAAAAGAVVALPITARLIGRRRLALPCAASFAACGLLISVVGGASAPLRIGECIVIAGWGCAMALADSTSLSLLHRLVRQKTLVPVISMLEAVKLALEGVGALLGALGFYLIGLRGTLVLGGLTLPVLLVLWRRRLVETDLAAGDHSQIVALLYGVPLFHVPDMVFLEDLASRASLTSVPKGDVVVTLGEEGDTFYVIASGHVRVEIDGFPVGELGPGASFGERALLRDNPRAATVVAATQLELFALDRDNFLAAVTGSEDLRNSNARSREDASVDRWTTAALASSLSRISLFSRMDQAGLRRIAEVCLFETWSPEDLLTVQGNEDESLFLVLSGVARVLVDGEVVGQVQSGDSFGEIAMLHEVPRRATLEAVSAMTTSRLDRGDLYRALGAAQNEKTIEEMLGFEHLSNGGTEPKARAEGGEATQHGDQHPEAPI
jgi:CRP-like cAMP-binding protein